VSDDTPPPADHEDPVSARERARHVMATEPHPDAAHDPGTLVAWCSCALWRSERAWERAAHHEMFEHHVADMLRTARALPANARKYGYACLNCRDEDAAVDVVTAWIDRGSARNRVFLDGSHVLVAFMAAQFLADVVREALERDLLDPAAVFLVNALRRRAERPPDRG